MGRREIRGEGEGREEAESGSLLSVVAVGWGLGPTEGGWAINHIM